jgi:prepilin-type processing-associated H-X9-DG protein
MRTHSFKRSSRHGGFTLVELLVVVAILIALAGLVVSLTGRAMAAAKEQRNMNRLRNLVGYVTNYAVETGHIPPGEDHSYTEEGYGPAKMSWQRSRDRYPDILNAFLENPRPTESFLSPSAGTKLETGNADFQPTNYIGHPALLWNEADKKALEPWGTPPFRLLNVRRPSEVFFFADGASIEGDSVSGNCATSVSLWAQNGTAIIDDELRANDSVDLQPRGDGTYGSIDFRNRGKAHVIFCDGSVRAMAPEDWKVRNVSLGF